MGLRLLPLGNNRRSKFFIIIRMISSPDQATLCSSNRANMGISFEQNHSSKFDKEEEEAANFFFFFRLFLLNFPTESICLFLRSTLVI